MRFSQYVKDTWDGDKFCHELADTAKLAVYKIFVEMAMGEQVIEDPKYPILHDADDYKYLIQFPPKIWTKALNWRYNDGIREIMRGRDVKKYGKTHIPEGYDHTDKLVFKVGNETYVFGKDGGPRNIYIGLTHLVKKLTAPAKGHPEDMTWHPEKHGEPHPHWAGTGPSLKEIDPNQTNPNDPSHPSNYKHGLYNFDLDQLAEVSDQDIDDIPDTEIQAWLDSPLSEMDFKHPEVQKAIKKIRDEMKAVKKHSMAAYDVPQLSTTALHLTNWITSNALPEKIYGDTKTYTDPYLKDKNGNPIVHTIGEMTPAQANAAGMGYISRKNPKEGGYTLRNNIPTIERHLQYKVIDEKGIPKNVDKNFAMPHLNPVKTIPQLRQGAKEDISDEERRQQALSLHPEKQAVWNWQPGESFDNVKERLKDNKEELAQLEAATQSKRLHITDEQKRQIAMLRKPDLVQKVWNWQAGESVVAVLNRLQPDQKADFRAAIKVDTLKNFLKFWDFGIWTPDQKKFIKENARSIHAMARHVFGKTPDTNDLSASPNYVYAAGFRPNYKSPAQGALNVAPEQMEALRKEYIPKLELELLSGVPAMPGSQKGTVPLGPDGKPTPGKIEKFLNQMEMSGDYAPQVIAALRKRAEPLAKFGAYILLTFLNDRRYGIKDDKYALLANVPEDEISAKANERLRGQKIQWFLKSAAQIGFDDILSRKYRERFGVPTVDQLSQVQAVGGEISEEEAKKEKGKLSTPARRRWLQSNISSIARKGQKLHSATAALPEFLETRRNQILAKMHNSSEANADLAAAEKSLTDTVEASIAVYNKYEEELKSKFPDPDKREQEALKLLKNDLAMNPNMNISDLNIEEVLQRVQTLATASKLPLHAEKIVGPMNAWVEQFLNLDVDKHQSINLLAYDEAESKVVPTHEKVTPGLIPVQPYIVANILHELYQYPKLIIDALHKYGFKMYEKIYNAHEWGELSPEEKAEAEQEMKQEWTEEQAKWEKSLSGYVTPSGPSPMPQQLQQQPQQAQPQQQQQQQAAKVLAQPLDSLFTMASTVNNSADMMKLGHALLSKRAEMIAAPGSAHKLEQAVAILRKNREFFAKGIPPKEEYIMFKQLAELASELRAEHNE